jgi:hypothetical protein
VAPEPSSKTLLPLPLSLVTVIGVEGPLLQLLPLPRYLLPLVEIAGIVGAVAAYAIGLAISAFNLPRAL